MKHALDTLFTAAGTLEFWSWLMAFLVLIVVQLVAYSFTRELVRQLRDWPRRRRLSFYHHQIDHRYRSLEWFYNDPSLHTRLNYARCLVDTCHLEAGYHVEWMPNAPEPCPADRPAEKNTPHPVPEPWYV